MISNSRSFDVVIASRYVHFYLQFAPDSQQKYLWSHDTELLSWWNSHRLPLAPFLKNISPILSGIVGLTPWHTQLLQNTYPSVPSRLWHTIGNGIKLEYFEDAERDGVTRHASRMIWSSAPGRGLDRVLRAIPLLKLFIPDIELHIFAHESSQFNDDMKQLLAATNGSAIWHGAVTQRQLAREMLASSFWFYPTHFRESFPITVLEVMAAGVIPFTVPYASLKDLIGDRGVLLDVPG